MGNQDAINQWWDPVISSAGRLEGQASPPASEVAKISEEELNRMSEEELNRLSPAPTKAEGGGTVKLTHPIPLPPGVLSEKAMQLKALERYKGSIEDLFPRAYQLLCNEKRFLGGTEPRELAFIDTHGRRWKAGEGFLLSAEGLEKAPAVPEIKFDPSPANLGASCQMLRDLFEGISFPAKAATLAQYVRDCHKAVHRERERRKSVLRAKGVPNAQRVSKQSYRAFVRRGLVFVGSQIGFLRDYLDLRAKRVAPATAERRVLAKRRVLGSTPQAEEKSS